MSKESKTKIERYMGVDIHHQGNVAWYDYPEPSEQPPLVRYRKEHRVIYNEKEIGGAVLKCKKRIESDIAKKLLSDKYCGFCLGTGNTRTEPRSVGNTLTTDHITTTEKGNCAYCKGGGRREGHPDYEFMSDEKQGDIEWSKHRQDQLQKLIDLLHTLDKVNDGGNFLEKTMGCIEAAKELRTNTWKDKKSFTLFLVDESFGVKEKD